MKKLLIIAAATLVSVGAFAQGKLAFVVDTDNLIYLTTATSGFLPGDATKTADAMVGSPTLLPGSSLYTGVGSTAAALGGTWVVSLLGGTSAGSLTLQTTVSLADASSSNFGGIESQQQVTLAGEPTPTNWSISPLPAQVNRVNSFGLSKTSEQYRKERLKEAFAQLSDPDPLMQWSGVRIAGRKGTVDDILPLLKAGLALKDIEAKKTNLEVGCDIDTNNKVAALKVVSQTLDDPRLAELAMPIL